MVAATVLGPIGGLADQVDQIGHGTYLLTECSEREGGSGQARLQLTLEDSTGRLVAFGWPEARQGIVIPQTPSAVSVRAKVALFDGKPQLKVQCLTGLMPDQVACAAALLPRRRCPEVAYEGLDRLIALECELPDPLDGFLRQVLLDPGIGIPLLRCRASVNHHHAYIGGLLVHCTEYLDLAAEHARRALPADAWAPHVARLGYLLHDIGKLRSVGESRRGQYGLVAPHELLTIEILAPHLAWLDRRSPDLAAGLRHVLAYLATPYGVRRVPDYFVAEIVTTLDHWSAATYSRRDLTHLLDPRGYSAMHDAKIVQATSEPSVNQEIRYEG